MGAMIHQATLYVHIAIGAVGLVVFWGAMATTKGSRPHVRFGRAFVYCMYAVALTAVAICLMNLIVPASVGREESFRPMSYFLLTLSFVTLVQARFGDQISRKRRDFALLRDPLTLVSIFLCSGTST